MILVFDRTASSPNPITQKTLIIALQLSNVPTRIIYEYEYRKIRITIPMYECMIIYNEIHCIHFKQTIYHEMGIRFCKYNYNSFIRRLIAL